MAFRRFTDRLRPVAGALCAGALAAVTLTACGGDSGDSGSGRDRSTAAASSTPETFTEQAEKDDYRDAVISTDLPDGESKDSGWVERVQYPVREGTADPSQNWADFYLPAGDHAVDSVPLVVFLHGGAWHTGATGVRHVAKALTDRGMAVLNVEYRDVSEGGGWPTTFTDVADAMDYVPQIDRRHPEITTDDETVAGHSAGAQLAAWAGTRGDLSTGELGANPRFTPSRVVSLAGPLDLAWAADHGDENIVKALRGTPAEIPEKYSSIDPIQNINRHIPVVAVHGTDDNLVPPANSEHYVDAVTRLGGNAKLVLLPGQNHVSFLRRESPAFQRILEIIHKVTVQPRQELEDKLDGGTVNLAQQK
jgi:acetyl esterase/lipase